MAHIVRHPKIVDYILEMTLDEIEKRGGVADIFEEGHIVLLKNYRLDFDYDALNGLQKSIDDVEDIGLRRSLKKLQAPYFFAGERHEAADGRLVFKDRIPQAVYDVLCRGDRTLYERASRAVKTTHEEALRIFGICFPNYEPFRFIPSIRLTRTLFENLHWDNHSIDDDFHQARIFANLDSRPRIWHVSHRYPDYIRSVYEELDLGRFAGKDPNEMLAYINGDVLGGLRNTWMENLPKHRIAFDPGEVWLGESRIISHEIFYGESAMVYMWFVRMASMHDADGRFNVRVERLHEEMSKARIATPAPA